jgi:hypothetical protein
MLTIERLDGGYVVTHHDKRNVATAENVAHLIIRFMPDVMEHMRIHFEDIEVPPEDDSK